MKIGRILALLFFLALVWQVVWIARGIKANSAHEVSTRADAIENGLSNYVDRAGRARSLIEAAFAKHKRLNEQYWKSHPEDSKGVHYLGYPTESEIIAIMGPPLFDITTQNETLPKLGKKLWGFGAPLGGGKYLYWRSGLGKYSGFQIESDGHVRDEAPVLRG